MVSFLSGRLFLNMHAGKAEVGEEGNNEGSFILGGHSLLQNEAVAEYVVEVQSYTE